MWRLKEQVKSDVRSGSKSTQLSQISGRRRHSRNKTSRALVFLKVFETQTESRQTLISGGSRIEGSCFSDGGEKLKYEPISRRRKKTKFS